MTTSISSDVLTTIITWLVVAPVLVSVALDAFCGDDKRHIYRIILLALSGFAAGLSWFEMYTGNIVNPSGGILDLSVYSWVMAGWAIGAIIFIVITFVDMKSKTD